MAAIFTYGFPQAEESFRQANCILHTLSNYDTLIQLAIESGYVSADNADTLRAWRHSPSTWNG